MEQQIDLKLMNLLEATFIKNGASTSNPVVLAAMITAASFMGKAIGEDASVIEEEILNLYGKEEEESVTKLLNMDPEYVKQSIGYAVDFMNKGDAIEIYRVNMDIFNKLYSLIKHRHENRILTDLSKSA